MENQNFIKIILEATENITTKRKGHYKEKTEVCGKIFDMGENTVVNNIKLAIDIIFLREVVNHEKISYCVVK